MTQREQSFELEKDPAPLVVVDFLVYAWSIFNLIEEVQHLFSPELIKKVIKALWAVKINRGPDMLPHHDYRIVVVSDKRYEKYGAYWRGVEINRDERMEIVWEEYCEGKGTDVSGVSTNYKGNRREKDDNFYQVVEIGWEYATTYFPCFKEEGFEADDWAGAIYRISRDSRGVCHDRQILLSTIDRDWSGLVDESHKIFWANTRYPGPKERIQERLAGEDQVLLHTELKLKVKINHPREIFRAKHEQGELSDNLPPGSPLEYIDLSEAHPKYQIEKLSQYPDLVKDCNNPQSNIFYEHLEKSRLALGKIGVNIPWP
jgi:5'-3' exonuclease